jgi:hypothetical protein
MRLHQPSHELIESISSARIHSPKLMSELESWLNAELSVVKDELLIITTIESVRAYQGRALTLKEILDVLAKSQR